VGIPIANILFMGREWGWTAYMFTVKDKESEATQIPIDTAFVDVRRFLTQTRLSPIYFEARWLSQIIQGHAPKVMYSGPQKIYAIMAL